MSRDGMIPSIFHKVNPRTLTPVPNTIIVCVVISILAGFIPINFLAEMTSIGTLVAFLVVSVGVIILRRSDPDLPRSFKVPGYPVTPISRSWLPVDHQGPPNRHDLRVSHLGDRRDHLVLRLRYEALSPRGEEPRRIGIGVRVMTLLAGYAPDGDSSGTVHLATLLARSSGEPLVICAVIPSPPPPGMARVDAEYHQQCEPKPKRRWRKRGPTCPPTSM